MLAIPLFFTFGMLTFFEHGPVARAFQSLAYPFQLDNVEGYLLDEALQLSAGQSIYRPITAKPYLVANYPPLYQAATAVFLRFGKPGLFFGRMLVLTSVLGICLCLFILALRAGRQFLPALMAPFLFTVTFELHSWIAYARVDLPSIFLTLLGLVCFLTEDTRTAKRLSIFFFVLALMTKQTAIAAPGACFLFLLWRNWRQALRFGVWLAFWVLLPTMILTGLTAGEYWRHTVTYNANAMDWFKVRDVWLPHLDRFYHFYLVAIAVCLVFFVSRFICCGWRARQVDLTLNPNAEDHSPSHRIAVIFLYFVVSLLNVLTLAKAGSAENYLLEPLVAAALFVSAGIGWCLTEAFASRAPWLLRGVAVVVLVMTFLHADYLLRGNLGGRAPIVAMFSRAVPDPQDMEGGTELLRTVYQSNGEVLSEDPIFLTLAGRRPPINPFILSQLAREGKWDQQPFIDEVEQKVFSSVITTVDFNAAEHFDRYTDEMAQAFRANYVLMESISLGAGGQTYFVYRPRLSKKRVINVVSLR